MRSSEKSISRKNSIRFSLSALSSTLIVGRHVLGGSGFTAPSERLNIACVGVGGIGNKMVRLAHKYDNVTALCDVDDARASQSYNLCGKSKRHKDFRKMLEEQKDIDAVMVGTPDHTHYVISKMAIEMGKHVYCQKPLSHNIVESRKLTQLARDYRVVTQMGNQGHSSNLARSTIEWVRSGIIGEVNEVHTWSNRPIWPQGLDRPKDKVDVPKTLNWDLWLGPAPFRPYHPAYLPFNWRAWWDFGTGALGDMGCHIMDYPIWALNLEAPKSVEARVTGFGSQIERKGSMVFNHESYPHSSIVYYQFPANKNRSEVKLAWYDGGLLPPTPPEMLRGQKLPDNGVLYVGEKGKILAKHGQGPQLLSNEIKQEDVKAPKLSLPRHEYVSSFDAHYKEWVNACRGGMTPLSNFDYAGPLSECVLLGNLAIRVPGRVLEWDSDNMKISNHPQLNPYVGRNYRKGWVL